MWGFIFCILKCHALNTVCKKVAFVDRNAFHNRVQFLPAFSNEMTGRTRRGFDNLPGGPGPFITGSREAFVELLLFFGVEYIFSALASK